MPVWRDRRLRKSWRYLGAYGPQLMLCAGDARIGPLRQRFWALATPDARLIERTALVGSGGMALTDTRLAIDAPRVRVRLAVGGGSAVETLSAHGRSYIWTRKTGDVTVSGLIELDGEPIHFDARGLVDESAGYHARHTTWMWSAGVGALHDGRAVAWNLVDGLHDAPQDSERSVWIDGVPHEVGPVSFDPDLTRVGELDFSAWAERAHKTNALILRSTYRQPFGKFEGRLPGGLELAEGYGVMEAHEAHW